MEIGGSQALMSSRINGGATGFNQPASGVGGNLFTPAQQQNQAQAQQTASVSSARGVASAGGNSSGQSVQQASSTAALQSDSSAGSRLGSRVDLYA